MKDKTNIACGHSNKSHWAHGMCQNCYDKSRYVKHPRRSRTPECGHPNSKHWAKGLCKKCYDTVNKDRQETLRKAYYSSHIEKYKIHQRNDNLRRFKITQEDYNKLFEKQNGICAICRNSETVVRNGKVINLSIDHAHACCPTKGSCGKCNRELLCFNCNRVLGCVNDNVDLLKAAIVYLEKHKKV